MNLKLCLVILLSLFNKFQCQSSRSRCSQEENDNMDLIVSRLFTIGKTGRNFPEKIEQAPPYCKYESTLFNLLIK